MQVTPEKYINVNVTLRGAYFTDATYDVWLYETTEGYEVKLGEGITTNKNGNAGLFRITVPLQGGPWPSGDKDLTVNLMRGSECMYSANGIRVTVPDS